EKFVHTRDPKTFNRVQVSDAVGIQLIEKGDVLPHVADAAAARPAAFRRQHAGDAVALKDRLHGALSQAENLTASLGQKFTGIKRQTPHASLLGHHQSDAQRAFTIEFPLPGEGDQRILQIRRHYAAFCPASAEARIGSKMCVARKLTTGTATPSPARW